LSESGQSISALQALLENAAAEAGEVMSHSHA